MNTDWMEPTIDHSPILYHSDVPRPTPGMREVNPLQPPALSPSVVVPGVISSHYHRPSQPPHHPLINSPQQQPINDKGVSSRLAPLESAKPYAPQGRNVSSAEAAILADPAMAVSPVSRNHPSALGGSPPSLVGMGAPGKIPTAESFLHRVEKLNESAGRMLRVTQKELSVIGGSKISTKIEVLETEREGSLTVVFSVKHTHAPMWKKQLQVHKTLLLACLLTGVDCPIEVPEDSVKVFRSTDNLQHVHIYLERIIPHFRFQSLPPEASAFWWRAVGCGSLVFQNFLTGRLIILPCRQKGLVPAAHVLQRSLALLRNVPQRFWEVDPDYAKIALAAEEEARAADLQTFPSIERAAEAVQAWALEDGVSPWMTRLIVKSKRQRGQVVQYRYSIGVDVAAASADPYLTTAGLNVEETQRIQSRDEEAPSDGAAQLFVAIQVHANEPLSRELKAYPVCMVPLAVGSLNHQMLTILYLRALWFLRKLFEYHLGAERVDPKKRTPTSFGRLRPVTDGIAHRSKEALIRQPDASLDMRAKSLLVGGARLAPHKGRFRSNPMHELTAQLSPRTQNFGAAVHTVPDHGGAGLSQRTRLQRSSDAVEEDMLVEDDLDNDNGPDRTGTINLESLGLLMA